MNLAEVRIERADSSEALAALRALSVDWHREWIAHLGAPPDGGVFVARREGEALGVGAGYRREEMWTLAHLAVRPGLRGEGLGGALLAAAIAPFEDCSRTAVVPVEALDGLSLAARRAMVPQSALLELSGAMPDPRTLAELAAGQYRFSAERLALVDGRAAGRGAVDALDRETRGGARALDHGWFAQRAIGTLFSLGGEVVGYAYAWPDGTVGPMAAASATYLPQMLAFALHGAAQEYRASWVRLCIPGACGRLLRLVLRLGLRIGRSWWWCAEAPPPDLSRYAAFRPEAP